MNNKNFINGLAVLAAGLFASVFHPFLNISPCLGMRRS